MFLRRENKDLRWAPAKSAATHLPAFTPTSVWKEEEKTTPELSILFPSSSDEIKQDIDTVHLSVIPVSFIGYKRELHSPQICILLKRPGVPELEGEILKVSFPMLKGIYSFPKTKQNNKTKIPYFWSPFSCTTLEREINQPTTLVR